MSKRSNRNRHTGRVNAAKRRILEAGRVTRSSDGRTYRYVYFDGRGPTLVRDFDAERAEAQELAAQRRRAAA